MLGVVLDVIERDRRIELASRGATELHGVELRRDRVEGQELGIGIEPLAALLLHRRRQVRDRVLGLVEIGDRLDGAVLLHHQHDAAVDVGPREGDLQRAIRVDRGHHDAEIDGAVLGVGPARGKALLEQLDLGVVAEDALGDQLGHVDVEADQLALVVDEAEGRRLAGDPDDDLAARAHLVELGLASCCGGRRCRLGRGWRAWARTSAGTRGNTRYVM